MQILSFGYCGLVGALLVVYYRFPYRWQNLSLLLASLGFCASWDWRGAALFVATTAIDYWLGRRLDWNQAQAIRRRALWTSVALNVLLLVAVREVRHWSDFTSMGILAPLAQEVANFSLVGLSFYTLVRLTHTFDVYYRLAQPASRLSEFLLFAGFFPLLSAGPVERARNILPQLSRYRPLDMRRVYEGSWLILLGLFKKVFIADHAGLLAKRLLDPSPGATDSSLATLLGVYAYALLIYCDFAGYSDIARGTARLFGIEVMPNFAAPYASKSLAEYWRRWHISLSSFLEDYVHRPLTLALRYRGDVGAMGAVALTFLLSGLWHGLGWTFLVWGAVHGLGLSVLYLTSKRRKRIKRKIPGWLFDSVAWLATFHYVCLGYVFFRAPSLSAAADTLSRLGSGLLITPDVEYAWDGLVFYALLTALLDRQELREGSFWVFDKPVWVRTACYAALLLAVVRLFAPGQEFIYAEF